MGSPAPRGIALLAPPALAANGKGEGNDKGKGKKSPPPPHHSPPPPSYHSPPPATSAPFVAATTVPCLAATATVPFTASTSAPFAAATSVPCLAATAAAARAVSPATGCFIPASTRRRLVATATVPASSPPLVVPSPPPPLPPSPVPVPPPPTSSVVYCKNTTEYPTCTAPATCQKRCPQSCHMDCDTCKPICDCNLPGTVCEDPRFIGGDGNTFYFHGRRDRDFCLLSDANLHINARFIGSHVPGLKRDPTWVQAIAAQFRGHRLYVGALRTAAWDDEADRLAIVFDGEPVQVQGVAGARWEAPASAPSLSVTRTRAANGVVVELAGVFRITANAVPITEEDSRVHSYGLRDGDCLAHLDLAFKFYSLTDDVHGVLGQTYRRSYVNRLDVSANMPVMGSEGDFAASGLFATDCAVARFAHGSRADDVLAVASGDDLTGVRCSTGLDGVGVVCKKTDRPHTLWCVATDK